MKSAMSLTTIGLIALSTLATNALAGRTIYIPPVFSNKDFLCPAGIEQKNLEFCWDFTFTNLSEVRQTVKVRAKAGTKIDAFRGLQLNSDFESPELIFDGTQGQSKEVALCVRCADTGPCQKGWATVLGGLGNSGINGPADGPAGVDHIIYHSTGLFQVDVLEDRGALVGRMNQRIFPWPNFRKSECRDTWTTPQVVVEINGGRAF